MLKRDKWHFLTTQVGYDRYTVPIFEAAARNKCVPLLKTLMSSYCMNNCKFCAFRAERNTRRERWMPEELARVAMKVWKDGRIRGLFLSSSVEKDPSAAVEKEIETVRILRNKGFTAYVHLRLMPGVDIDLIKQSVQIADRVGINIEFPRAEHYDDMKIFLDFRQDLIKRIKTLAHEVVKAQKQGKCKAGLDTQMVVGASNETDKQILQVADWLYHRLKTRRVYFSAFEPIKNTPLENKAAENRWREYRLYQCSFLLQKYNYHAKDFVLNDFDNLPVNQDPKILIAKQNELRVDVNDADYVQLIKVPGIGPQTAKNILKNRPIKNFQQLKQLGVLNRALQFLDLKKEKSNAILTLKNFLK
jgi:predicted DNA-binding helix-hairpin-helix protein